MRIGDEEIYLDDIDQNNGEDDYEEAENERDEERTTEDIKKKPGFFKRTLSPGKVLFITADMGAGKTGLASSLMEDGVPLGYNFYTNVLFFKENRIDEAIREKLLEFSRSHYIPIPKEIHIVTTASELIRELYKTVREKKSIVVLDEAMFFAGAKRGTSKELRWFEELVVTIRKFGASLVLICQVKSMLASLLKEKLPSYELEVYKLESEKRNVDIFFNESGSNGERHYIKTWEDVPPSRYPFDSIAPASFKADINMEKFVDKISKLDSLESRDEIPRILDELLNESNAGEKDYTIREKIEDILAGDPDASDKEIQNILKSKGIKCTISYIGQKRRELK